jgi:hypothetical protein
VKKWTNIPPSAFEGDEPLGRTLKKAAGDQIESLEREIAECKKPRRLALLRRQLENAKILAGL